MREGGQISYGARPSRFFRPKDLRGGVDVRGRVHQHLDHLQVPLLRGHEHPRPSILYRGTSLIRNSHHHRALDIGLLLGPRGRLFLMSEAPPPGAPPRRPRTPLSVHPVGCRGFCQLVTRICQVLETNSLKMAPISTFGDECPQNGFKVPLSCCHEHRLSILHRVTSLIRNSPPPPRTTIGP